MNYTQITMGIMLSLLIGSATADCLSSIKPEKDGVITWSDLAKYDACLKADKVGVARAPLTLEQATWAAACSGGAFSSNKCFGGSPNSGDTATYNANTKLVMQVTNLYAIANLSLTATYPAGSIWIGQFPARTYMSNQTSVIPSTGMNVQAVCGAFTEIGWGIPSGGLNGNIAQSVFSSSANYITNDAGSSSSTGFTMLSNQAFGLKTPLYIICVGRSTTTLAPAALPSDFAVTWSLSRGA